MSVVGPTILPVVMSTVTGTVASDGNTWTPMELFANGELGWYWDGANGKAYSDIGGVTEIQPSTAGVNFKSIRNLVRGETLASMNNTQPKFYNTISPSLPYASMTSGAAAYNFLSDTGVDLLARPWTIITAGSAVTTTASTAVQGAGMQFNNVYAASGQSGSVYYMKSGNSQIQIESGRVVNELNVDSLHFPNTLAPGERWKNGVRQADTPNLSTLPGASSRLYPILGMGNNSRQHGMIMINRALTPVEQVKLNNYWQTLFLKQLPPNVQLTVGQSGNIYGMNVAAAFGAIDPVTYGSSGRTWLYFGSDALNNFHAQINAIAFSNAQMTVRWGWNGVSYESDNFAALTVPVVAVSGNYTETSVEANAFRNFLIANLGNTVGIHLDPF